MIRVGSIFKIKPELKDGYKKAHDKIWPELARAIKNVGLRNYSIFFRKDGTLFSYLETDNYERSMAKLSKMDVAKRWWKYMDKYFVKESESRLGPETEMLEEVFHLDEGRCEM